MIGRVRFAFLTVVETLLRVLPFPCKTGLIKIGNPGRDAPVFLTCNFRLTVERVRRALKGMDAYLLVANSKGVNVWCAATGGLFTNHDVVSVLRTSGIEALVDHRRVILPQLAATGIESRVVRRKTGWNVVWGPVYAASIPAFFHGGMKKTASMRTVRFPWTERLEMAVSWAFPISLLCLAVYPFWKDGVLPLVGFVWAWSFLVFMSFPLYERYLKRDSKNVGFVFFDFGQRGLPLLLWVLFLAGLAGWSLTKGDFSWPLALRWGIGSLVVVLIFGLDLTGSTPLYKSGLHEDRLLRIVLDTGLCKGAADCERVCPVDVFEVDSARRMATLPRQDQCVQCGACIVQCPFDALRFRGPKGDEVLPETVRRFKLNLIGTRKAPPRPAAEEHDRSG
jgi:ferredoxin